MNGLAKVDVIAGVARRSPARPGLLRLTSVNLAMTKEDVVLEVACHPERSAHVVAVRLWQASQGLAGGSEGPLRFFVAQVNWAPQNDSTILL